MLTGSGEGVRLPEADGSGLARVLQRVGSDLQTVRDCLGHTLRDTRDPAVREIVDFLLAAPGKQLRPALVLLSVKAAGGGENGSSGLSRAAVNVAAAVELIHMASLVHDDLIDAAAVRHDRASLPAKWGARVSAATGDYLCSRAFELVARCRDPRLFGVLGLHLCTMCEGELMQVIDRRNFHLSEHQCLAMTEKKTAALFGACCGAGALIAGRAPGVCLALQEFGFHFGIAFQVLDDCKDLLGGHEDLGKAPGQDWRAGDVTLPLLYAIRYFRGRGGGTPAGWPPPPGPQELARLGDAFRLSPAPARIVRLIESHVDRAKRALHAVADSVFKDGLHQLADHIAGSAAGILAR